MFSIDGQVFNKLISQAARVVGKEPDDCLSIRAVPDKGIFLYTHDAGRIVYQFVACPVEKKCKFRIPLDRLQSLTNKRGLMNFSLKEDGQLSYSSSMFGKYSGLIETLELKDYDFKPPSSSSAFSNSLRSAIFDLSKYVSLKPQFVSKEMLVFVEIKSKKITVVCGDGQHVGMVIASSSEADKDEAFTFPLSYVQIIQSCFQKTDDIRLSIDQSHIHIKSITKESFTYISLPLIDTSNEAITLDKVKSLFAEQDKLKPDVESIINMEEVNTCLSNMEGIKDKEKTSELVIASTQDKQLLLQMQSRHGKIKQLLPSPTKGTGKILLNPLTAEDIFSKIKEKTQLRLLGERICLLEVKLPKEVSLRYLILGIQPMKVDER